MSPNTKTNVALGGVLIAIVIAIAATFGYGATSSDSYSGVGTRFPDGVSIGKGQTTYRQGLTIGADNAQGVTQFVTTGTCSTASTTLFAVTNPFSSGNAYGLPTGTSTAKLEIYGTNGATTTDIIAGTSTTAFFPGQLATSSLNQSFFGVTAVATSSPFYFTSGNTVSWAWPKGTYGNTTYIQVDPGFSLVGFATSTYGGGKNGGTAAASVAIPSSCTYRISWYL